ncbi:hypothetical protein CJ263_11020 [Maribacter cobaltidurans]|uniref:Uncharacterized protein n=1 Tax=Maribacter cobaltidurans TaxID=1178778 RepID=A0A223V5K6_9FLAO|nr:hypothetical protein CJ263_11020 [Maribacter cobaltidurans]GGD81062.1 hypothetical protein GCM10011412_18500 [Maribacter cobaltidurans]
MKIIYIKRESNVKEVYRTSLGRLNWKVTYIKKYFLGMPFKTMHKYTHTFFTKKNNRVEKMLFI